MDQALSWWVSFGNRQVAPLLELEVTLLAKNINAILLSDSDSQQGLGLIAQPRHFGLPLIRVVNDHPNGGVRDGPACRSPRVPCPGIYHRSIRIRERTLVKVADQFLSALSICREVEI
jgi:hypothetical protein